jgi:hypothetical protein
MALGTNMRIDKLIPDVPADETKVESRVETPEAQPAAAAPKPACPENIDEPTIKVLFTPSRRSTIRKISVTIQGDFTISMIAAVKDRLVQALENYDHVGILLKDISQLDLSAIQLLSVLKQVYTAKEKNITIDSDLTGDPRSLAFIAGFSPILKPATTN